MCLLTPRVLLLLTMASLLVGCTTPARRTKVHSTAFGLLSPLGKKLVRLG